MADEKNVTKRQALNITALLKNPQKAVDVPKIERRTIDYSAMVESVPKGQISQYRVSSGKEGMSLVNRLRKGGLTAVTRKVGKETYVFVDRRK